MDPRGRSLLGKAVAVVCAVAEAEAAVAKAVGARRSKPTDRGPGIAVPKSAIYLALGADLEETERVLRVAARAGWLDSSAETVWLLPKGTEVARLVSESEKKGDAENEEETR